MPFDPSTATLAKPTRFDPSTARIAEGEVKFNAGDMLRNTPKSAGGMVKDIYQAARHPIDTAKALGNLSMGVAQKAIPGRQDKEIYADQVGQFIVDRYGSIDDFKSTLMNDPVGVLADASMVLTGGGAAAARAPGAIGKIGKAAETAGAAIDPLNVATNTASAAAKVATPAALPRSLYDSNVKWRPSLDSEQKTRMTETALREGMAPNDAGVGKAHLLRKELSAKIGEIIDSSAGQPVDVTKLFKSLDDTEKSMTGFQVGANDNRSVISNLRNELKSLVDERDGKITLEDLQNFKVSAGKDINWKADATRVENEAMKGVRSAAREGIEEVVPEVAEINKRLGEMLEIQPELERAAGRRSNLNPIGLTGVGAVGAGALAAGDAGAVAAGTLSAMQRKSTEIAVFLEKLRTQKVPENYIQNQIMPVLLREAAVQLGRLSSNQKQDDEINEDSN